MPGEDGGGRSRGRDPVRELWEDEDEREFVLETSNGEYEVSKERLPSEGGC